jgi:exo-1,4-beta-D-glucosaminidase
MPCSPQFLILVLVWMVTASEASAQSARMSLERGWTIRSSARLAADGAALSRVGVNTSDWLTATVPTTVVGAMVSAGRFQDPYVAMNLRSIPGTSYPIGTVFATEPLPARSPYRDAWWFRTEFNIPSDHRGRTLWLHFDGINYRANIWLNGVRIATSKETVGAYRRYEFDVTRIARVGSANALAVEVFAPQPGDLGINWVDWNPTPADKNMGLWGPVYLTDSGPVALRHAYVVTTLNAPAYDQARLTVLADVWNATDRNVTALVGATIENIHVAQSVALGPHERKTVRITPEAHAALILLAPRLWWPYRMGPQNMYAAALDVTVDKEVSDREEIHFGIRDASSELTPVGHRLFRINGKPILIRGGGWSSDMLLRPITGDRLGAELHYVREMGLNTIRLEGKLETDEFHDRADREGILVMAGWCCCDQWEMWNKWDAEDHAVGPLSLRDQLLRLRNHPSLFVWLNGSDKPPIAAVERKYLDIEAELDWNRPVISNAADAPGPVSGPSGVKMLGPYEYVPPSYWLTNTKNGGAFGFATEISPGPAVPPIDSLRTMLTPQHLWPIDAVWSYHAGGAEFRTIDKFTAALEGRYGKPTGVEDYARKAQALAYEGERAMFEAYARNKYASTGVIQWMLNNAWPSIIWHLYDYYLRPGGGYFGTKKACEPVHVQYSYDDRSIVIVNDTLSPVTGLKVSVDLLDFALASRFSREVTVDLPADGVVRPITIPALPDLTTTYFLKLSAQDDSGHIVSTNFYWLSTHEDELNWSKTEWYYTPTTRHADLTMLSRLPATRLSVALAESEDGRNVVRIENSGTALAFQVHLKLVDPRSDAEYLPVFWDDNYFALFPGERREIGVTHKGGSGASVEAEAWNVPAVKVSARDGR